MKWALVGNNGLTDFKEIFGFSLQSPNTKLGLFVATAVILALAYCLCHFIVKSKMGRVVTAIRDSESRVRFVGYKPEHYKVWIFCSFSNAGGSCRRVICTTSGHN